MDSSDWHHGRRGIDRHAAAVKVIQPHHAINVRVLWQQIALDEFHHIIHHACHTVNAGGNAEQILGSNAAVCVAIAFKGVTFQRWQRLRDAGRQRQGVQRWGFWQLNQRLINPAALRNGTDGIANDFTITHDFTLGRDIHQRHFMPLRNMFNQLQAIREAGSGF